MESTTDIAIIGGGLASLAAALELKQSGYEITLIRKAPGAAALSNGVWDLCDGPLRYPGEEIDQLHSVGQNIMELLRRRPHHPYQLFSGTWGPEGFFAHLQDKALRVAENISLDMEGDASNPIALLNEMGTFKTTGMAPATMVGGDFRRMKEAKLLIVGIEGLSQFNAAFIRESLEEIRSQQKNNYFSLVGHWDIPFKLGISTNSLSPFALAQSLDQEPTFVAFGKQIQEYLKQKVYTHLFFPAVLGMLRSREVVAALKKITSRAVAEVLPLGTSVPGWRLSEAILHYFKQQGYDTLAGEVVGFESQDGRIQSLTVHRQEQRIRIKPKSVILATGKFLGGGLRPTPPYRESVFGLPLYLNGKLWRPSNRLEMSQRDYSRFQDWRSLGILTNSSAQALDLQGKVAFSNLFAAGQILSGWDFIQDPGTAGVSIVSGSAAGKGALQWVKSQATREMA